MILQLVASILLTIGIAMLFNFTPQSMTEDVMKITTSKMDLRKKVELLNAGKKKKTIGQRLNYIKNSLDATGRESMFGIIVAASFAMFAAGAALAVLINNYFLVPAFAVAMGIIPFVYVKSSLDTYKRHIAEELETSLSIITTSYLRSDDIVAAVKENLDYLKPPLRDNFLAFINDATYVTNMEQAIRNLRSKVDNDTYHEWCDALLQCQSDRVLKDTLQPIVNRFTDVRIVNSEIAVMMSSVRVEYYTMVAMVVSSIPLLYVLNKDWYQSLMYTTAGKATLGLVALVIVFTYTRMLKYTEPVEYKG